MYPVCALNDVLGLQGLRLRCLKQVVQGIEEQVEAHDPVTDGRQQCLTALVLDNDQLGPLIEIDIAQAVQRDLAAIDLERVAGDSQGLGGDVQEVAAEALAPYLASTLR